MNVLAAGLPALLLVAVTAVAAADVASDVKPVEVQFDGPESCSSGDAFFGFLRSRTKRVRRALEAEPHTTLLVRLGRVHGQVLGELRMVDDRGGTDTRKVQGASCDEVVQALSLTAALALDPAALMNPPVDGLDANADATATAKVPDEPASVAKAPEPDTATTNAAETAPASRPISILEVGAGPVALGVLSGEMSPGVVLIGRKTFGKEGVLTPTLGIVVSYVRNDVFQSPADAQVSFAGMGVTLCPVRFTASILTVQPCALVLAGWVSATGRQMTIESSVTRSWLSAGATVRAAAALGHGLSVELEGGISAPLYKRRFWVTVPENVVAETPAISPVVGLALTYGW